MMMTPGLRKLGLTAHVTFSVGWLGAVGGFLALAIGGLASSNAQTVRAAYLAMDLVAWFVIVPLSVASLATGVIQALGTQWGLVQHYWVLIKLIITLLATALLLLHMQPIGRMAVAAAEMTVASSDLRSLRIQLIVDASLALVALLVTTALSIYKPRGLTRYGRQRRERGAL